MKKNDMRVYIVLLVICIVFSVIAFEIPFVRSMSVFWVGYLFGIVAIAFQIYVYKISLANEDVKSKFYGFPIARIGAIYLIVQLVVSLIEMGLTKFIPTWVVVVINIILVAIAFVGCIAAETMRDEIERQDVVIKKEVRNIRALQSLSASLVNQCNDSVKKVVSDLAEEIRYSDPVSCEKSEELEQELDNLLKELQKVIIDGDDFSTEALCKRAKGILNERNRLCKLGKQ